MSLYKISIEFQIWILMIPDGYESDHAEKDPYNYNIDYIE